MLTSIHDKLFNAKTGILIPENITIGGPLFRSFIFKSIQEVEGVLSIKDIQINGKFFFKSSVSTGAGNYFDFEQEDFELTPYSDIE